MKLSKLQLLAIGTAATLILSVVSGFAVPILAQPQVLIKQDECATVKWLIYIGRNPYDPSIRSVALIEYNAVPPITVVHMIAVCEDQDPVAVTREVGQKLWDSNPHSSLFVTDQRFCDYDYVKVYLPDVDDPYWECKYH